MMEKTQLVFKPLGLKFHRLRGWLIASLCHEFHFEMEYTLWFRLRLHVDAKRKWAHIGKSGWNTHIVSSCCLAILISSALLLPNRFIFLSHLSISITCLRMGLNKQNALWMRNENEPLTSTALWMPFWAQISPGWHWRKNADLHGTPMLVKKCLLLWKAFYSVISH